MLKLRDYQQEAINRLYRWLQQNQGNPCLVAPTGSGKAILIAEMIRLCVEEWRGRVLVLAHVKELLEQEGEKLKTYLPEVKFTYYSAGIGEKDFDSDVVIAGIQSIYKRAAEAGRFDLILVDECHLIPDDGEGMYRTFLLDAQKVNPKVRLIGFTASPFRTGTGSIVGKDKLLNDIAYEIPVRELIDRGFLSPLKMKGSRVKIDCSSLHIRAGEFVASEVESLIDDAKIHAACLDIIERTQNRKSVLIFTSCVKHAEKACAEIKKLSGQRCEIITGDTPTAQRDSLNQEFRGRLKNLLGETEPLKYLVNVNVLTTGFDAPGIDCVVLLRPTASPVLYLQMVGRGLRIAEGKKDCLVLDYGGNAVRHGPIDKVHIPQGHRNPDAVKPQKECPECHSVISAGYAHCPDCGYEFPVQERRTNISDKAGSGFLLTGDKAVAEYEVRDYQYRIWRKKNWKTGDPETVRCDYQIGLTEWVSEWVCPEHVGYARKQFEKWWKAHSDYDPPISAQGVIFYSTNLEFARPERVRVTKIAGEKWPVVEVIKLSEKEMPVTEGAKCGKCVFYDDSHCSKLGISTEPMAGACMDFSTEMTMAVVDDLPF